jgi:hypothetical protein
MENQIDISKHPYGLGGGTILTGSVSTAGDFFWFHPISSSIADIKFKNLDGSLGSTLHSNGVGVYGFITEVTQSSGKSIVYAGQTDNPKYTFAYPSYTPTPTPTVTVSPSKTPSISLTPSISISNTPSISVSATPSVTPSISVSKSISVTPSVTPSISVSKSISVTPSISVSKTPSVTPSTSRP